MLEWQGEHQHGTGIRNPDELHTRDGFDRWVQQLLAEETAPAGDGFVTCTYYWMVEHDEYLGSIALRHELTDFLSTFGGHIGYGVRPTARGRGIATDALKQVIGIAHERGIHEVLLTCDAQNPASRRVIESNGGQFENEVTNADGDVFQRFWVAATSASSTPVR